MKRYRDSISGRAVSKAYALANPNTTTAETVQQRSASSLLASSIKKAVKNLDFMDEASEPQPIRVFDGKRVNAVNANALSAQIRSRAKVEERTVPTIFDNQPNKQFFNLYNLLKNNLSDLKAFAVGEVQVDLYIVGRSADGNLMGIYTRTVES